MANLLWNESSPADTDNAGQGDDEIRSLKTSIRNGMAQEHVWPSNTGSGFGVHLLGSARAAYDVQSNVSSTGTDGRLMVTSDSSRLFHVGSGGTMYIGGQNTISAGSRPVGGQRFYWVEEFGRQGCLQPTQTIAFPNSGFSGVPFTQISYTTTLPGAATVGAIFYKLINETSTTFDIELWQANSVAPISNSATTIIWRSIGTRTF